MDAVIYLLKSIVLGGLNCIRTMIKYLCKGIKASLKLTLDISTLHINSIAC